MATVIDLATRMVIGWQLATHMCTSLITDALAMVISHGHVAPEAMFHSDRGTQAAHLRGIRPVLPGPQRAHKRRRNRRVFGQRRS